MNTEILNKYMKHLRQKYRKHNTRYGYYEYTKLFLEYTKKPYNKITKKDLEKWHIYITEKYKPNGNVRRITSVNYFFKWLGKKDFRLPIPHQEEANRKILSQKELDRYIESSKTLPLDHLIAILEIDGLLRPIEFSNLKISNIDREKMIFYLDDTKTGNNSVVISPKLLNAINEYLPYRNPKPGYEDYLIVNPKGKYQGLPPSERGELVRNHTKQIAFRAKIEKKVTPYVIKPSSITIDFENRINPKIIQRKARHRRIETTLRYDHTDDDMVRKHFIERDLNIDNMDSSDKRRLLFERYIKNEIDIETLKQGLETLDAETQRKYYQGIGYA